MPQQKSCLLESLNDITEMKLDIDFRFILTAGMLMLLKTDTADTFASVSGEGKRKKKKG